MYMYTCTSINIVQDGGVMVCLNIDVPIKSSFPLISDV
jgi:hypothetical protein